jgi:hypothetical protein
MKKSKGEFLLCSFSFFRIWSAGIPARIERCAFGWLLAYARAAGTLLIQ